MRLMRLLEVAVTCFVLLGASGCKKASTPDKEKTASVKAEARLEGDEPPRVVFDIKSVNSSTGSTWPNAFDCTYQARGKTARFRLEFKQDAPMAGEPRIGSADGKFVAVAGSDNSALLEDLQIALDAKHIPAKSTRLRELGFDAAILGEKQSRIPGGGFSAKPPGDWTLLKLFLPEGGDEGEVYLNLSPKLGKAEFSIKDSDYGDYLLKEFAKVF